MWRLLVGQLFRLLAGQLFKLLASNRGLRIKRNAFQDSGSSYNYSALATSAQIQQQLDQVPPQLNKGTDLSLEGKWYDCKSI